MQNVFIHGEKIGLLKGFIFRKSKDKKPRNTKNILGSIKKQKDPKHKNTKKH